MISQVPITTDLVLVGGGHAHALVLRMWGMDPVPGVRLTLIDPRPVAPYTGMLPGHVAGHYSADDIGIDLVRLTRFAGARLILGAASALDPVAKTITVGDRVIGYDVASIDIGITGHLPQVAGFADHGVPVKPFADFSAAWERYLAGPRGPVTVIGGGLGGVELALAMRHRLGPGAEVRIIGRSGLAGAGAALGARLQAELDRAGIDLITGSARAVTADHVTLGDGQQLPSALTVGAGGATPQAWLGSTSLPLQDGFIKVKDTLQVIGHDDLFAAGDCAHLTHDPRPKAGVYAVRAAKVLRHNLRARATGGALKRFHPQRHFLRLVSLGDRRAVAEKWPALPVAPAGGLIWRWKDQIDRRFMRRLTDLPVMAAPTVPRGAAVGVRDILSAAPLCAGCGSKVGAGVLGDILSTLPQPDRPDVETGPGDDAGVLRIGGQRQVLTTDHLRAFTDDPGLMARIAAQHALGDVRAMGAQPQSALAQIILPRGTDAIQRRMMAEIMQAASDVFAAEGAVILGGHSTMGAELTIGFTVTGLCDADPITVGGARAGDAVILTGRIGAGVLLAAEMQGKARGVDVAQLWSAMAAGPGQAARILRGAHAMTDVTGFGLAGHLMAICRASGLGAEVAMQAVPIYPGALEASEQGVRSTLYDANRANAPVFGPDTALTALLHDPQTAGGFLATVAEAEAAGLIAALTEAGLPAARIGRMTDGPTGITLV
ncbi:selenide, water dikinase SelD [Pseudooceanicola onchidii]|uniref:selenide, water dikinase SelD n=1 Tax=Pseudooceanicola onchidii TaxID=2562279 RepID=UPI0010AAA9DC|nr:selenide, water dikinase SelD [Pseudooceanicola onchidii]